jgi:hypothetical protein
LAAKATSIQGYFLNGLFFADAVKLIFKASILKESFKVKDSFSLLEEEELLLLCGQIFFLAGH